MNTSLDAEGVYRRLCAILPGFAEYFERPELACRAAKGPLALWVPFRHAGFFLVQNRARITDQDYRQLGKFISACIADADGELATAARQYFLDMGELSPLAKSFEETLSSEALELLRASYNRRRRLDTARSRFDAACMKSGEQLRQTDTDLLLRQPFIQDVFEARMARLVESSAGPSEKIVLGRVAKPFFKEHLPQFKWVRDRDCRLQLDKPLERNLRTLLHIDKEPAYQVGKLFMVVLGVAADSGPYAGAWLFKEIAEIAGLPAGTCCWRYKTREDLDHVLGHVTKLVLAVLPCFEQAVREEMLRPLLG